MTREEIKQKALKLYPIKEQENKKATGTYDANLQRRKAFEEGAKWADETMIAKAVRWLKDQEEMIGISFEEDFLERFKEAMEE